MVSFSRGRRLTTARVEAGSATMTLPVVDIFEFRDDVRSPEDRHRGCRGAILADPRFRSVAARVVALENHALNCPEPDPKAFARRLLAEAGYQLVDATFHAASGQGMLWGWRPA